jgi:hypothetical protein
MKDQEAYMCILLTENDRGGSTRKEARKDGDVNYINAFQPGRQ